MQLGMIGLGRMGDNMVRRLLRTGHACVVHDRQAVAMNPLVEEGAIAAATLQQMAAALSRPRVVWLMVPAAVVDALLAELAPLLESGDIVIDGGNSNYRDDIRDGVTRSRLVAMSDAGRPRADLHEVALWEDMLKLQGNELFYAYMVDNQAIVVPETIDAIRALTGAQSDAGASIAKTDAALGFGGLLR